MQGGRVQGGFGFGLRLPSHPKEQGTELNIAGAPSCEGDSLPISLHASVPSQDLL